MKGFYGILDNFPHRKAGGLFNIWRRSLGMTLSDRTARPVGMKYGPGWYKSRYVKLVVVREL